MRNIIVGTAGHIDHGKTALVKALTGIDADRLAEEKRRGITIDLGFAHLQLTRDIRLGFIDVPGHERFVRNMLAGAAGIDLVLFVIAADESIKAQTREHFDICRMLGVQSGVVALTRCDLVDPDLLELSRLEADEFLAGSFLESAPRVAVSSVTGEGIPALRAELAKAAAAVREKAAGGIFRLPIDRSFTMRGFGTVVTGTMISGTLQAERDVELYPVGRRLRVRGLQVYGEKTGRARAGERAAVNLAGVEPSEIGRGMVLGEPGRFTAVTSFDCRLDLLVSAKPLKNDAPVHLHIGSAEVEADVRFLDRRPSLDPGATAWTRVKLCEPVLALPGDRFIIRMFSPVSTIGGGVVADIAPRKYKRGEDFALRLTTLLEASPRQRLELLVAERTDGIERDEILRLTGFADIPESPTVEKCGKWLVASSRCVQVRAHAFDRLRQFHKANSLLPGMPREDLKNAIAPAADREIFDHALAASPEIAQEGEILRLKTHRVVLKVDEEQARAAIEGAFQKAGLATPSVPEVLKSSGLESARARSVLQMLLREGRLVRIDDELVLHTSAAAALKTRLAEHKGRRFAVPEFKEWTGVSRKYAIPLLEYLDREHVTRREGDGRVVL